MPRRARFALVATLLVAVLAAAVLAVGDGAARGKRVYVEGLGEGKTPVNAAIGDTTTVVPASTLPCIDCHGPEGRGSTEGGVAATDIRPEALAKALGADASSGRARPAYDRASLARAITRGIDAGGNRLAAAMPRYEMEVGDLEALLDYMQRLGREAVPGVAPETLKLGAVLPLSGGAAEIGSSIRSLLEAFATRLNTAGGVHGRRIEWQFVDAAPGPDAAAAELDRAQVFAAVGSFVGDPEQFERFAAALARHRLPLVGPVGLALQAQLPPNPYVFHVLPDFATQIRALVARIPADREAGAVLVAAAGALGDTARGVFEADLKARGVAAPHVERFGSEKELAAAVGRFPKLPTTALVIGTPQQTAAALRALLAARPQTEAYSLAALAGREALALPAPDAVRVTLAYPGPLPDGKNPATEAFARFLSANSLKPAHLGFQLTAYAAMQTVVEGLKRSGRALTRETFGAQLEALQDFPTALGTKLGYGPNRRHGSVECTFVRPDPTQGRFVPIAP